MGMKRIKIRIKVKKSTKTPLGKLAGKLQKIKRRSLPKERAKDVYKKYLSRGMTSPNL